MIRPFPLLGDLGTGGFARRGCVLGGKTITSVPANGRLRTFPVLRHVVLRVEFEMEVGSNGTALGVEPCLNTFDRTGWVALCLQGRSICTAQKYDGTDGDRDEKQPADHVGWVER